ncbi:SpoIIE family protein phosphatase [Streptomyces sp. NPDC051940]|uniref:SpoIIE family protein phosphatase n=1 Tax=Streptomyces sp. NPDC051940 TaxID=3155675 RepID=UPI0034332740
MTQRIGAPDGGTTRPGRRAAEAFEAVVADSAAQAARAAEGHAAGVFVHAPDGRSLVLVATAGLPAQLLHTWWRIPVSAALPVAECYRTARNIQVTDTRDRLRRYPQLATELPYAFGSVYEPVLVAGRPVAVLAVMRPEFPGGMGQVAHSRLTAVAAALGAALADADLAARVREHALAPVSAPIPPDASQPDVEAADRLPEGVLALDQDGRLTYANPAAAALLGAGGAELAGRRPWEALGWLSDTAYEERYRAALMSQRTATLVARHARGQWLRFVLYPDRAGLTVRITPVGPPRNGAVMPAPPTESRVRPGALSLVVRMASSLTEAASVREVCEALSDGLLPSVGGQEIAVYTVRRNRMYLTWQSGYPEDFLEQFEGVSITADLPGVQTMVQAEPRFYESREQLSADYPHIAVDRMSAWAFLPLIASGHPLGSCILGFATPRVFSGDDRSALEAVSGLVAQALDRARLYDAESALARGLQDALLPRRLPTVPGLACAARYLPGTRGMDIGGDWYDVIETPVGVALVIGDVEGHSVAAAAVMGQLRSAVSTLASSVHSPHDVMRHTNRLLHELDPEICASCCYLLLDPATGRTRAVRAGHLPPLMRHPGGGVERLELAGGPLLGVAADSDYPVTEFTMPPGAALLLYTDGLVERPGQDIDRGITWLRSMLATAPPDITLQNLADRILHDADLASERPDDVAVLLAARSTALGAGALPGSGSLAG